MRNSVLFLLLASASAAASAQDQEIVVTGRGLDDSIGQQVYGSVTIDREELAGSASNRLEEILRGVPGFQLFRRSDARSANPTSQGATLRALGGNASSRVLLVLDGVPQTDPFGGWISWPAYDPRRLQSAQVTRGGGSGVYGPGALAGTIELFSLLPSDRTELTAEAAYGSRNSLDAFAGANVPVGQGHVLASASYAQGNGFVPVIDRQRGAVDRPSPYEQASASIRAVTPLSASTELQASGMLFSDERDRGTAFSDNRTKGADASLRLVGNGRWRWSALAYLQTRDYYNSFGSVDDTRSTVSQVAEQYSVPSEGLGARLEVRPPVGSDIELRIGGDWRRTEGRTQERYFFVDGAGTRGRIAGGRTDTAGAFAEAAMEAGALTATAGARIDRWWISDGSLTERELATGAFLTDTEFADRSGWEPTGRVGVALQATTGLTARAAGYLGWRLPVLNELYRPFRVGQDATAANANLAPERLQGVEIGLEYRPVRIAHVSLTLFSNRLENAIANVTLGEGPGLFPGVGFVAPGGQYRQRRNLSVITAQGIELEAGLEAGAWSLDAGYSYVDAEVEADGPAASLDGLRPAQTPRRSLSTRLGWHRDGAGASLEMRYMGAQFEDDLNEQLLPDALVFNAAATLPIRSGIGVQARVENLTDERVVAGISGDGIIERATPRTFWIGLRMTR